MTNTNVDYKGQKNAKTLGLQKYYCIVVGDKCKWQQNVNFEEGPLLGMTLKHHSRVWRKDDYTIYGKALIHDDPTCGNKWKKWNELHYDAWGRFWFILQYCYYSSCDSERLLLHWSVVKVKKAKKWLKLLHQNVKSVKQRRMKETCWMRPRSTSALRTSPSSPTRPRATRLQSASSWGWSTSADNWEEQNIFQKNQSFFPIKFVTPALRFQGDHKEIKLKPRSDEFLGFSHLPCKNLIKTSKHCYINAIS